MSSVFIDPKIDFAFKIIFGGANSQIQLTSFLNAMLFKGEAVIKYVTILNPYLPGEVATLKDTYVDVQAELDDGSIVIIEMQMSMKPDFFKRMIFNVAKKYSSQLESGDYYSRLHPVIGLVIANFTYDEAHRLERPITQYALLETSDHILYPDSQDFQITVVELPKFRKQIEQLSDVADMWLYLLNHADDLIEVPSEMKNITEIQTALAAAKRINLSSLALEELEKRRMYAMQEEENLAWARRDALKEGIDIGRAEGHAEGRAEGSHLQKREMIKQMLGLELPLEQIAHIAGLSVDDVRQLQEALFNNGRSTP